MDTWELLDEVEVLAGFRRTVRRRYRMGGGVESTFDVKAEDDAVSALALTDAGHVLLVRQFRVGPGCVVDELPGGGVEAGEDPVTAMARELLEETGHVAAELREVGPPALDCAYSTRRRHHFVALGCRPAPGLGGAGPAGDGHEQLELVVRPFAAFLAQLRAGDLTDVGGAYRALDAAGLLCAG